MATYHFKGFVNPEYNKVVPFHPRTECKTHTCKDITCAKRYAIYMLDMEKNGVKEFWKIEIYNATDPTQVRYVGAIWNRKDGNYTYDNDIAPYHGTGPHHVVIGKDGYSVKTRKKKVKDEGLFNAELVL